MKYFGTDGFRGVANEGLNVEHAFLIGRFVGWYYGARLGRKARILIGKDTRRSSYMFEAAITSGIVASGADAYTLHVVPTPGLCYEVVDGDFDCGAMITASHNPYQDNGIKLVNSSGYKMDEEVLELVEQYIDGEIDVPLATGDAIGCTVDYIEGRNRYIGHLIASANFSLQGVRVGLDCANGAASSVAKPVFDALGADVYVVNNAPSGFNINVNCGSTHIQELQNYVVRNHLDVGFAYDGDADRCLAVDENGHVVDGDLILYVCGRYLHKYGRLAKDTVVPTVMSNYGLFKAFEELGIHCETTAVGDRFVYACMREHGYTLGGEQSGHIIFGELETTGDGIMTSLRLMEAAHRQGCGHECPGGVGSLAEGRRVPGWQRPRARACVGHRAAGARARRGAGGRTVSRGQPHRARGPQALHRGAISNWPTAGARPWPFFRIQPFPRMQRS